MKPAVLYLCHRIPYPPNKGDKIASYHLLKFLSQHFDVYLGCFIDDRHDQQYRHKVEALCRDVCFITLHPALARLKGLQALYKGQPITLPYYSHPAMTDWVNHTLNQHPIERALVFSSSMAQYLLNTRPSLHKVMHFVDVDSEKWRQYAQKKQGVASYLYQREYRTLAKFEKAICADFDVSCFVTETERQSFAAMVEPALQNKIHTLENGIDSRYFSPQADFSPVTEHPLQHDNYVVFTGAMDYWANVDAVTWFARKVWPKVLKEHPYGKFYIVGSSPSASVRALSRLPGIVVTGRVDDVRPYLLHAKAAIAPMQIARGIQNKILEAMAMEKPVLTTPQGMEGLEHYPGNYPAKDSVMADNVAEQTLYVAEEPQDVTDWVCEQLARPVRAATLSRQWIEDNFSWDAKLSPVLTYLEAKHV
ncbi:TIGR03087 family PEP-CTERM/XrtA system glycosyltransferase [Photobacterium sp. CAU 1568]|uniref:TIGR03087 family PEP-CTERM/XrtA system glycosyltransferase n=1 Tax=Photobacterium arenosum TaxID=2774143 RepID=A0ABR9BRK4_9GAMM|nr:TIGR03087 family PEP-CTERM/XrtA system glycosyltransferase [Photobacterium arenosum]MBD8514207.1 TIGR03087 family PEP-CTERM/XrtA system glycosyltransferase [Photobacterium arenosum]